MLPSHTARGLSWTVWNSGLHRLLHLSRLALECYRQVFYLLDDSNAILEQFLSFSTEKFSTTFHHLPWALVLQGLKVGNLGVDFDSLYQEDLNSPTWHVDATGKN